MARIAIIGAGLSGLVTAIALKSEHTVVVFDKSRGPGGRMATRYTDRYEFDHGAQFFTARSDKFKAVCRRWLDDGIIAVWGAEFRDFEGPEIVAARRWDDDYPHYVGTPRMNAIGRYLARDIDLRFETPVARLHRNEQGWSIEDSDKRHLGVFDWVVLALPAPQAAALLPDDPAFRQRCASADMRACYALMLGFSEPVPLDWHAAHVQAADISWMSVNSSKPGRSSAPSIVVHSTNAWANRNMDLPIDDVKRHLLNEFHRVSGLDPAVAAFSTVHRWRYANVPKQVGEPCYLDEEQRIGACGDWFVRGRIEAAFTSAGALVDRLRERL